MGRGTEPKFPPKGRKSYTGPRGGTFVKTPTGNKEYWGNNGK